MRAKPVAPTRRVGSKPRPQQVLLGRLDGLDERRDQLLDRRDDPATVAAIFFVSERILRQGLPQALQHAVVVDDDAAILAGIDAVRAGDGLHQVVCLHRLVDVEGCEALHVEAGQPHRADDGNAEGMLRVLEGVLDVQPLAVGRLKAGLHHHAVRDDVEIPLLEVADFVLRFADDDLDDGAFHPLRLPAQRFEVAGQSLALVRVDVQPPARLLRRGSLLSPRRAWPASAARSAGTSGRR